MDFVEATVRIRYVRRFYTTCVDTRRRLLPLLRTSACMPMLTNIFHFIDSLVRPESQFALCERVREADRLWTRILRGPDFPLSKLASCRFGPHGGEVKNTGKLLARLAASYTARLNVWLHA